MPFCDKLSGRTSRRTVLRKGAIGGSIGFLGLSSVARTGADDGPTTITEPTTIDEPGEYVLEADLIVEGGSGLVITNSADVTLDGNGYRIEGDGSGTGLFISEGDRYTVRNLTIEHFETGLQADGTENTSVSSVTVQNTSERGIFVSFEGEIHCEDSTIRRNGGRGILIDDYSSATIQDCEIVENGTNPIVTGSSAILKVKGCHIADNGAPFDFTPMPGARMEETQISGSDGAGVYITYGDIPYTDEPTVITDCVIQNNADAGIYHDSSLLEVRACTLKGNTVGYHVGNSADRDTILQNNNIEGNDEYGVLHANRESNPPVDATCNWWGHESGPVHEDNPTENPRGQRVSDGVAFAPWSVERIEDGGGDCTGGLDEDEPDGETPPTGIGYIGERSYKKIEGIGPYDSYGCWDGTFYITDRSDIENLDYGSLGGMVLPSSTDGNTENGEDCQLFMGHVIRAEADAVPVRLPTWSGERGGCESLLFVEPTQEIPPDVEYRIASTDGPIPQHEDVDTNGFAGTIDGLVAITFEPAETS
ncbi:MAG: right-handed parallel beta-helix repeat-containing protein [Halobacteriota archaeon]|uniref:right-handed parallel beta-helix repeat-containing protein n=1 Tax=Natronomonas sp. TaxID=2184060 RepID=UPI0039772354